MSIIVAIFTAIIVIALKYLLGVEMHETIECYLPCVAIFCIGVIWRRLDTLDEEKVEKEKDEDEKKRNEGFYFALAVVGLAVAFLSFLIINYSGKDNIGFSIGVVIAITVVILVIGAALICSRIRKIEQDKNSPAEDEEENQEQ